MGFFDFLFKKSNEQKSPKYSCAHSSSYVILDVETTGLNPMTDKVIQLSAIKYDKTGKPIASYDTYLNPGISIPAEASKVNKITDRMVSNAPCAEDIRDEFLDFLGDCLIVGYNTTFDLKFIKSAFDGYFSGCSYVDAMTIARKTFDLPNYKLQTVAACAGFNSSRFHNSLVDCEAVAAILRNITPNLNDYAKEFGVNQKNAYGSEYWQGVEYYRLGENERRAGNYESALRLFEKARNKGYHTSSVYISIAMIYRKLNCYDSEIAILEEGLSACDPPNGKETILARKNRTQEFIARNQKREAEELQRAQKREARLNRKQEKEIRLAQQARKVPSRAIVQLSDDGAIIKKFPSVSAASCELSINPKCIRDAAKGRQKHAGGYCWQYVSPDTET